MPRASVNFPLFYFRRGFPEAVGSKRKGPGGVGEDFFLRARDAREVKNGCAELFYIYSVLTLPSGLHTLMPASETIRRTDVDRSLNCNRKLGLAR